MDVPAPPSGDPHDRSPGADGRSGGEEGRTAAVFVAVVVGVVALVVVGIRILQADPPLAVVGDSITLVSGPAIGEALDSDHDVDVAAALGVRVEQMQGEAARLASRGPEQAVIELGSNDVLQRADLEASAQALDTMIDTFLDAGVSCVHVVNVSTVMTRNDGQATAEGAEQLNRRTAAMAEADDRVVIVDWNAAVVAAEERGESLTTDTVHPDGEGMRTLASLLDASLADGCT